MEGMAHTRRSTVATLVMAFGLSLGAPCVVSLLAAAQKACCNADQDCAASVVAARCCQAQPAEQTGSMSPTQRLTPPLALISSPIPALVHLSDTRFALHVDARD